MVIGENCWTVHYACEEIRHDLVDHGRWLGCEALRVQVMRANARWKPPPSGCVSLMGDGAYSSVQQRMSMGGLVRDLTGSWLGGFFAGAADGDPLYAEMQVLLLGLKFLWRNNWRKVICGVDCLKLVSTMGKGRYDFHQYGSVLMDIHLLSRNWEVKICHAPRKGNVLADCLAEIGADLQCAVIDLVSPPVEVLLLLHK